MNIATCFPSKYLKGAEIEEDLTLTIRAVEMEDVGSDKDKESKPIVYFEEHDKGLVLNKTNANTIAQLHGPDTDAWIGKQITLFSTEVDFQGQMTLSIRVRLRKPAKAAKPVAAASAPAKEVPPVAPVEGSREATFAVFKAKVNAYMQEDGATAYTAEDLQTVFRSVMGEVFPGRKAAELTPLDWAKAAAQIEQDFDPATKALLPF